MKTTKPGDNTIAGRPGVLAVVPTPMTASGAVSAGDLERYVRWFRGADVEGVLLWTAFGGGSYLDASEREELYSVWRSGLLPNQQVWVEVPAGGAAASAEAIQFQAAHARELGADGIVTSRTSEESVRSIAGQLHRYTRGSKNPHPGVWLSIAAALKLEPSAEELFGNVPAEMGPAIVLGALEKRAIITRTGSCSPAGVCWSDLDDPELCNLADRLASHIA